MADGTKRALEFRYPHHATLRVEGGPFRELYGGPEVTFEISGYSDRWQYGEKAEPQWATGEIEAPPKEIERGNR